MAEIVSEARMAAHRAHKDRVARMESHPAEPQKKAGFSKPCEAPKSAIPIAVAESGPNPWDTLAVGESNGMAAEALRMVIRDQRKECRPTYNPLYIYGPSGSGKTHLLRAAEHTLCQMGRRVLRINADRVIYGDGLPQDMANADVLLFDDVHFIHTPSTVHALDTAIAALTRIHMQVVITSDRAFGELRDPHNTRRSALGRGLTIEIAPPDYAMRRAIITNRLEELDDAEEGVDFPEAVADLVADTITWSGHDVEGAVNRIVANHKMTGTPINTDTAQRWLGDLVQSRRTSRPKVRDVLEVVSRHYGVSVADIVSARRTRKIIVPRHVAMYLCKIITPQSLPEIGRRLGKRDHSTVAHAVSKITSLIEQKDEGTISDIRDITRLLNWSAE